MAGARRPTNRGPQRPQGMPQHPQIGGTPKGMDMGFRVQGPGMGGGRKVQRRPNAPGGMPQQPSFQVPQEFLGGYDQGDTQQRIARNEYLNTLPVGGQREQAMNQMGYWNGGTPYTPEVDRGFNRAMRSQTAAGGYDAPGIYQQMDPANRGYVGAATIGDDGTGTYQTFAPNHGRFRRRGGTTGGMIY